MIMRRLYALLIVDVWCGLAGFGWVADWNVYVNLMLTICSIGLLTTWIVGVITDA